MILVAPKYIKTFSKSELKPSKQNMPNVVPITYFEVKYMTNGMNHDNAAVKMVH